MKGQKVLFSHKNDDWETPQDLFEQLNTEFNFICDLAANKDNAKCALYVVNIERIDECGVFVLKHNEESAFGIGLKGLFNKFYWCNPPYSRQRKFVQFSIKHKLPTVFLLPSRTDTKLFHDLIYKNIEMEIRFLKGRLTFKRGLDSINAIKSKIEALRYDLKQYSINILNNQHIIDEKYQKITDEIQRLEKTLVSNDCAGFPSMIVIYRPTNE